MTSAGTATDMDIGQMSARKEGDQEAKTSSEKREDATNVEVRVTNKGIAQGRGLLAAEGQGHLLTLVMILGTLGEGTAGETTETSTTLTK
jgi:hypothetical protein